jgi:porin
MDKKRTHRLSAIAAASLLALTAYAADPVPSNVPPHDVLLLDRLGRVVKVPTNEMPAGFLPPPKVGLERQIPEPIQGASQPEELQQRGRDASVGYRFLPSVPAPLAPYLASQNHYGNLAARPGPLFPSYPLEPYVQGPKYWLSEYGLDYSLQQTLTFVNMTGVKQGDNALGYYTLDLKSAWAIYDSPDTGTAGWIRSQLDVKSGVGDAGQDQDARSNLGTITDPTGIWSAVNGVRVPELAWGQSAREGELVALAGVVNQGNYIDQNAYAQSGRGQFINSALINSLVLPLPQYNFGLNLQWQPLKEWYAMAGASAGNNTAGYAPWTEFNFNTWSLLGELGYAPKDVFGLGPGIYRIDPFLAQVEGSSGGGLCFNLQQKLGQGSPFGWFGRFGFGAEAVSHSAAAQIGTGFVMQGPFEHVLLHRTSNDLLGVGFVWSQPSESTRTVYHQNEYIAEVFYALQFSPTVRLQPDFQFVTNPAYNRDHDHAMVFQLQLILGW